MSEYKLVPFPPTPEMVAALKARLIATSRGGILNAGHALADAISAAPAAEGEPKIEPYDAGSLNDFGGGDVGWWHDYIRAELDRAYEFYLIQLSAAPQPAPQPAEQQPDVAQLVAFCEDAALSIAERTFSTEVDEQLASDIIQYAQRLHSLYTAPQPVEQQPEVLAEGYFHPLPDESDYEFHDAEQFPDGSDCPACVPAVIVRKSAVTNQPAPDVPGLTEALRQYQHNDGSGLVFGYDKLLVDQYVAQLVKALMACAKASSAAEVGLIVDAALIAHRKQGG